MFYIFTSLKLIKYFGVALFFIAFLVISLQTFRLMGFLSSAEMRPSEVLILLNLSLVLYAPQLILISSLFSVTLLSQYLIEKRAFVYSMISGYSFTVYNLCVLSFSLLLFVIAFLFSFYISPETRKVSYQMKVNLTENFLLKSLGKEKFISVNSIYTIYAEKKISETSYLNPILIKNSKEQAFIIRAKELIPIKTPDGIESLIFKTGSLTPITSSKTVKSAEFNKTEFETLSLPLEIRSNKNIRLKINSQNLPQLLARLKTSRHYRSEFHIRSLNLLHILLIPLALFFFLNSQITSKSNPNVWIKLILFLSLFQFYEITLSKYIRRSSDFQTVLTLIGPLLFLLTFYVFYKKRKSFC